MQQVKWIKITTDIFNDEKIQLIESMPDSDTIIVVWFKLLALAGKSNNGGLVMISDKVPYTSDMLATLFRRKKTVVDLALHTFEQFDMIEILDNDAILISNWEKHQNTGALEKIRENNRKRQQRSRDKQKRLLLGNKKEDLDEEDLDNKESNKDSLREEPLRNVTHNVINYKEIIDYLNEKCGTRYKHTTNKTQALIKARWNEGWKYDDFVSAIDNAYTHWSKSGDLTNMNPKTLFNGSFESRVTNDAYKWDNKQDNNDIESDWFDEYWENR